MSKIPWLAVWLVCLPGAVFSQADSEPDFEGYDLEESTAGVSDGELRFITPVLSRPVHHHDTMIGIHPGSMADGWVDLSQCHYHLDQIGAAEIVFHPERIRRLLVKSAKGIDGFQVKGPSVQLTGIGEDASICITAETQALVSLGQDRFRLKNGPYMRRFLDGYFPLHLTLTVIYPPKLLTMTDYRPEPDSSGEFTVSNGRAAWDVWFEGMLFTEIDFKALP